MLEIDGWTFATIESMLSGISEETNKIELKQDWPNPTKLEQTICAMANADGGHILIGVDDDHKIVGIADFGEVNSRVSQIIGNSIYPPFVKSKKVLLDNEKIVIILEIYPSKDKPVQCSNGAFYYRMQGRNQFIPRSSLSDMFVLKDIRQVRKTKLKSILDQSIVAINEEIAPGGALKNGNQSIVFEKLLLKEIMDNLHDYPYFLEDKIDQTLISRVFRICNNCLQKWKVFELEEKVLLQGRYSGNIQNGDMLISTLQERTRWIRDGLVTEITGLKSDLDSLNKLLDKKDETR